MRLRAQRNGGHIGTMTRIVPSNVDAFVEEVGRLPARTSGTRGRLLFAMDATASREPTWDHACGIQGEMFVAAEALGGLDVRLAFYRGFDEFKVSRWTSDGRELARLMSAVRCLAGRTQIGRRRPRRAAQIQPRAGRHGGAAHAPGQVRRCEGARSRWGSCCIGIVSPSVGSPRASREPTKIERYISWIGGCFQSVGKSTWSGWLRGM